MQLQIEVEAHSVSLVVSHNKLQAEFTPRARVILVTNQTHHFQG